MGKEDRNSIRLFNRISPIYGLFYQRQRDKYREIIEKVKDDFDLTQYETILDVGCGTGALCSVLADCGLKVTGVDPAEKMLHIARKRDEFGQISYRMGDVLEGLPFPDKSFDVVVTSYVAHGMDVEERKQLYREMSRLARDIVVIYDYNKKRSPLTNLIEWLEGGDYFRFIRVAEEEMRECMHLLKRCFSSLRILDVDTRAAWYLCEVADPFPGSQSEDA